MNSTGVFIDVARQYASITRPNRNVRIDYKKFLEEISKENQIRRAYAYGVQINNESEAFIGVLKYIGFTTRYKYAKLTKEYYLSENALSFHDKPNIQETSWALGIAMDVVRNIDHLSKVILGSNDIELLDLIQWIKERGVIVEIWSKNIPHELKCAADKTYDIPISVLKINGTESNVETTKSESVELPAN